MSMASLRAVSPTTEIYTRFGLSETLPPQSIFERRIMRTMCNKKRQQKWNSRSFHVQSSVVTNSADEITVISSEQRVYYVVLKQAALVNKELRSSKDDVVVKPDIAVPGRSILLEEGYDRCGDVCAEDAKTFYLGTTPEKQRAIWAIYVWCRGTDELADEPNA